VDPMIRNRQDAMDAVEAYSPAERQFNRRRSAVGAVLGPRRLPAAAVAAAPAAGAGQRLSAIMGLMFVFWVSETLPVA